MPQKDVPEFYIQSKTVQRQVQGNIETVSIAFFIIRLMKALITVCKLSLCKLKRQVHKGQEKIERVFYTIELISLLDAKQETAKNSRNAASLWILLCYWQQEYP